MTKTFIPRALAAGGRLLVNTRVRSIRREGSGWMLRCRYNPPGQPPRNLEIQAESLFLACGAIQTPMLLRRSGIKRNIGNSLAMHSTVKVTARFPGEVNAAHIGVPTQAVDQFAPRFYLTCALSTPAYLALEMLQYPAHLREVDQSWTHMAIYAARISGGRGFVRRVPGFSDPLVQFRLTDEDMTDLSEATRQLCSVLFAAGAEVLYPSILLGEPLWSTADLARIPKLPARAQTNLMSIHLSSSCPMGENQRRCATDSFGKVHGVDDLYVADASLLCTAPGVNPQGSIMGLVRRNVLHFLGEL